MSPKDAPYGTWTSPITSDAIVQKSTSISDIIVDSVTKNIYHIEGTASGAYKIVRTRTGEDVVAGEGWNVRSGVHEYGGGAAKAEDNVLYFSNYPGPAYSVINGKIERITPENKPYRYSAFAVHPTQRNLIVAVMEDHTFEKPADVVNTLVVIDTDAKDDESRLTTLLKGADFYMNPSFSPDGQYLAWHQWDHPDMPWEGGQFYIQEIKIDTEGNIFLGSKRSSVGYSNKISALSGGWVDAETASFNNDESGFWNPWVWHAKTDVFLPVLDKPIDQDFDKPAWFADNATWCLMSAKEHTRLSYAYRDGRTVLYVVNLKSGELTEVTSPYVDIDHLRRVDDNHFVFLGSLSDAPSHIALGKMLSLSTGGYSVTFEVLKSTMDDTRYPKAIISTADPRALIVNNEPLYVVLYHPKNPEYKGSSIDGELPPCVLSVHGGPTWMTSQGLSWERQYYTSRGFAWLDVNYSGSSGFGRKYAQRLAGKWGIIDVADCINAVKHLSSVIDIKRSAIRGGSSGGYTTLAVLANAPDPDQKLFTAGVSYFGVSNIVMLAEHTHKFESHYIGKLMGGTYKEIPKVYEDRSPVNHADRIVPPLLILQGTADKVIPPEQAQKIYDAIRHNQGVCEIKYYEGEGHGFIKAENRKDALDRELAWYKKVYQLL